MPPSLARTALSASIRCNACTNASVVRRAFASLPASRQVASRQVGPESPRYIEVPQPRQPTAPWTPVVKGSLPVPRNIFVNRSKLEKGSDEFLSNATREPSSKSLTAEKAGGPHAEHVAWKQRLSALRRKNLREGVTSLHRRKQRTDQFLAKRGAQRQQERHELLHRSPGDDELYTQPTVSQDIYRFLATKRNAATGKSAFQKRRAFKRRAAAKSVDRKRALHTLYVHARDYIVTEDQLTKVIDETFGTDDDLPGFSLGNTRQGRSIWARGELLNTARMLASNQGRSDKASVKSAIPEVITRNRIHRIAEELTGGKIELPEERY